jgi:hypothetical protein
MKSADYAVMTREDRWAYAYERRLDGLTFYEIGVEMGVTGETVRHWCGQHFDATVKRDRLARQRRVDGRWTQARVAWLRRRQRVDRLIEVADWMNNRGGAAAFDRFTRTLHRPRQEPQT